MSKEGKKKSGESLDLISKIPKWGWLLISFLVAIALWYCLSIYPKTARSFPFAPKVIASLQAMIEGFSGKTFPAV